MKSLKIINEEIEKSQMKKLKTTNEEDENYKSRN